MNWSGNLFYKDLIECHKDYIFGGGYCKDYAKKRQIAMNIVNEISCRSPSGRFLRMIGDEWFEVDVETSLRKTRQALREGAKIKNTEVSKCNKHVENKHAIQETCKFQEELIKSKAGVERKEFVSSCETPTSALSYLKIKEHDGK